MIDVAQDNDYILKVANLGVKLQSQILLDHLRFNVKKGTTLAILGQNGAGKTWWFSLASLFLPQP